VDEKNGVKDGILPAVLSRGFYHRIPYPQQDQFGDFLISETARTLGGGREAYGLSWAVLVHLPEIF